MILQRRRKIIVRCKQRWYRAGLPVIAMNDVNVPANSLDCLNGGTAKEREPFSIVRVIPCGCPVERLAIKILWLVNEPDRYIMSTGKSSSEKPAADEFPRTHWDRETDICRFISRVALVDTAESRHDDRCAMPQCCNSRRKSAANVCQTTRFREWNNFGGEVDDVHCCCWYRL